MNCWARGCASTITALGLCNRHYRRWRRSGYLHPPSVEERFFAHVTEDATGCWMFDSLTTRGYGQFQHDRTHVAAHRWAYQLLVGEIPDGLTLDHLCRVRACVNPWHLEPVPHRTNILRGEGPAAINARRTQCVNGHPFTSENTYLTPDGRRQCRTCIRRRGQARLARLQPSS